ncbi:hypothetical protein D3C71_1796840 [compost metagenome]
MLAHLAFEADVGLDDEFGTQVGQAPGKRFPLVPLQNHAKVRGWHIVAIYRVAKRMFLVGHLGMFVDDQLMAIEVEVDPLGCGTSFFKVEHLAVELASRGNIVNRNGEMERGQAHQKLLEGYG